MGKHATSIINEPVSFERWDLCTIFGIACGIFLWIIAAESWLRYRINYNYPVWLLIIFIFPAFTAAFHLARLCKLCDYSSDSFMSE